MKLELVIAKQIYLQRRAGENTGVIVLQKENRIEPFYLPNLQRRSFQEIINASRVLAKNCQGCFPKRIKA